MSVNASPQHSQDKLEGQAPLALVVLNADGSMTLHPRAVQQIAPGLKYDALMNFNSNTTSMHTDTQPMHSTPGKVENTAITSVEPSEWFARERAENAKKFSKQGRLYSRVFRKIRNDFETRYAAEKHVADSFKVSVENFRHLKQMHERKRDERIKKFCQDKIWACHLDGMTNRQIAEDLGWHEKTVANWIRGIRKMQKGNSKNVSG